jgi:hypothetical protein
MRRNRVLIKFNSHPQMNDMTYIQHMRFSIKTALTFGRLCIVGIVHAIFPWIWSKKVSDTVLKLAIEFRLRRAR